jgi:hypothetical protein
LLNILYSVVKERKHSSREPCTILRAQKRVKGPFYQIMVGYSLKPHALTATLARGYRGKKHKHPANRWEDNKGPPRESSTIYLHDKIIIKKHKSPVSMRPSQLTVAVAPSRPTTIPAHIEPPKRLSDDIFVIQMTFQAFRHTARPTSLTA